MKTTALLVLTDGRREYIQRTIPSALSEIEGLNGPKFIQDDSGDEEYRQWLRLTFPNFELFYNENRQGQGASINSAWKQMKEYEFDYVFHLEDDFTFNRPVVLRDLAQVLENNPHVYQMALRRQAWNHEEIQAGGVIERWPTEFTQEDGWISHRMFYTFNPHLHRRSLINRTLHTGDKAEGLFVSDLFESDPEARFGYWGQKTDNPWVLHIGARRKGTIY